MAVGLSPALGSKMKSDLEAKVIEIARSVVSGTADPNRSCTILAELCQQNNWPEELASFGALAHEQTDHEEFGFTVKNTAPLIIEECRLLLSKTGST